LGSLASNNALAHLGISAFATATATATATAIVFATATATVAVGMRNTISSSFYSDFFE
jgi:hypothetical protein